MEADAIPELKLFLREAHLQARNAIPRLGAPKRKQLPANGPRVGGIGMKMSPDLCGAKVLFFLSRAHTLLRHYFIITKKEKRLEVNFSITLMRTIHLLNPSRTTSNVADAPNPQPIANKRNVLKKHKLISITLKRKPN